MENALVPSALRYRNLWKMRSYPRIREAGKAVYVVLIIVQTQGLYDSIHALSTLGTVIMENALVPP